MEHIINKLKILANSSNVYHKHAAALVYSKKRNIKDYYYGYNKISELKSIHAEMDLFINIPKKPINGLDIIVIRINKRGKLVNSRPCNSCLEKLNKLGIRKVFYSNENSEIVCEFISEMKLLHASSGFKYFINKNKNFKR